MASVDTPGLGDLKPPRPGHAGDAEDRTYLVAADSLRINDIPTAAESPLNGDGVAGVNISHWASEAPKAPVILELLNNLLDVSRFGIGFFHELSAEVVGGFHIVK